MTLPLPLTTNTSSQMEEHPCDEPSWRPRHYFEHHEEFDRRREEHFGRKHEGRDDERRGDEVRWRWGAAGEACVEEDLGTLLGCSDP